MINLLRRRYAQTESDLAKEYYEKTMVTKTCPDCNGQRINEEARSVKINGLNISEIGDLSIKKALDFITNLKLTNNEKNI